MNNLKVAEERSIDQYKLFPYKSKRYLYEYIDEPDYISLYAANKHYEDSDMGMVLSNDVRDYFEERSFNVKLLILDGCKLPHDHIEFSSVEDLIINRCDNLPRIINVPKLARLMIYGKLLDIYVSNEGLIHITYGFNDSTKKCIIDSWYDSIEYLDFRSTDRSINWNIHIDPDINNLKILNISDGKLLNNKLTIDSLEEIYGSQYYYLNDTSNIHRMRFVVTKYVPNGKEWPKLNDVTIDSESDISITQIDNLRKLSISDITWTKIRNSIDGRSSDSNKIYTLPKLEDLSILNNGGYLCFYDAQIKLPILKRLTYDCAFGKFPNIHNFIQLTELRLLRVDIDSLEDVKFPCNLKRLIIEKSTGNGDIVKKLLDNIDDLRELSMDRPYEIRGMKNLDRLERLEVTFERDVIDDYSYIPNLKYLKIKNFDISMAVGLIIESLPDNIEIEGIYYSEIPGKELLMELLESKLGQIKILRCKIDEILKKHYDYREEESEDDENTIFNDSNDLFRIYHNDMLKLTRSSDEYLSSLSDDRLTFFNVRRIIEEKVNQVLIPTEDIENDKEPYEEYRGFDIHYLINDISNKVLYIETIRRNDKSSIISPKHVIYILLIGFILIILPMLSSRTSNSLSMDM